MYLWQIIFRIPTDGLAKQLTRNVLAPTPEKALEVVREMHRGVEPERITRLGIVDYTWQPKAA